MNPSERFIAQQSAQLKGRDTWRGESSLRALETLDRAGLARDPWPGSTLPGAAEIEAERLRNDPAEPGSDQANEALIAAVCTGDSAGAEQALAQGASPRARLGPTHPTVLQLAVRSAAQGDGNPEMISTLLDAGAKINERCALGESALHEASLSAPPQVMQMLLRAGADPTLRCHKGRTPLELGDLYGTPAGRKARKILHQSEERVRRAPIDRPHAPAHSL